MVLEHKKSRSQKIGFFYAFYLNTLIKFTNKWYFFQNRSTRNAE